MTPPSLAWRARGALRGPIFGKPLYVAVGLCAVVIYLGALWNRFAFDDIPIVLHNSALHAPGAWWRAFASSYWPAELGGGMYRPIPIASYALDWLVRRAWWFHGVNVLWHAATSVAVAALARRWSGDRAALAAGLVFAVHPVHVEAVANIVGRAEVMAALFAILSVYAALIHDELGWSLLAGACALLSKENGAVAPALVAWGWMVGLARPTRRRMALYVAAWAALAALYGVVRWTVLQPYAGTYGTAPAFLGAPPLRTRLTAIAEFADFARLLVFPLKLRADYSPAERTLVASPLDVRFALGVACFAVWAALVWLAWRRGRRVEAFGLGWIGIALMPVANLLFPVGVLVAERTLYLPSVGLALAAGAWLERLAPRRLAAVLAALVVTGGVRTATRVPVWRDQLTVVLSILEDSPRSFDGPSRMVDIYLMSHQPEKALQAFDAAQLIYRGNPWLYASGADAAFSLGRPPLADSMLARLNFLCAHCAYYLRYEAMMARARGDSAVAESLLSRLPALTTR